MSQRGSGRKFDPALLKVFLELPHNTLEDWRRGMHDSRIYRVAHSVDAER